MRPKTTYDPQADAVYFRFSESSDYQETTEVAPNVMLDFDSEGRVLGMEVRRRQDAGSGFLASRTSSERKGDHRGGVVHRPVMSAPTSGFRRQ